MKSTHFALTVLGSTITAYAESVSFTAKSENSSIDFPISSIHEGAGINFFLASEGGSGDVFDLQNGIATNSQGDKVANLGISGSYLASGPAVTPSTLSFNGDVVDCFNFFVCKNTGDPNNYSEKDYIIAVNDKSNVTAPFDQCTSVSIIKSTDATDAEDADDVDDDADADDDDDADDADGDDDADDVDGDDDSDDADADADADDADDADVDGDADGDDAADADGDDDGDDDADERVITTDITVTGYTTYCPEPTVVTITTCDEDECSPYVITATEATTLSVTENCVVPTTYTSFPETTVVTRPASSRELRATASTGTSNAQVSSFQGGAERAAVGAAGLAAAVAFLI